MGESSSEMSTEEMTEALSLEEKTEASLSALGSAKAETSSTESSTATSLQEKDREAAGSEENSVQADSAENTDEAGNSEGPGEANAQPPAKFTDKDPLELVPYIEKYMLVQLEKNYSYIGFVHSIDPITLSVILSVPKEDGVYQTVVIPGTSVLEITEAHCDSSIIPPKRKQIYELPKSDLQIKKAKVISWLKENRIPVTEDGEKIVFGGVTLLPPYGEKDICTTNSLIAIEIKNLIVRMPADYKPK